MRESYRARVEQGVGRGKLQCELRHDARDGELRCGADRRAAVARSGAGSRLRCHCLQGKTEQSAANGKRKRRAARCGNAGARSGVSGAEEQVLAGFGAFASGRIDRDGQPSGARSAQFGRGELASVVRADFVGRGVVWCGRRVFQRRVESGAPSRGGYEHTGRDWHLQRVGVFRRGDNCAATGEQLAAHEAQ